MDTTSKNWFDFWVKRTKTFNNESAAYISGWIDRSKDKNYKITEEICKKVTKLLELKKGDRVLDVGCGAGVFAQEFFRITGNYVGTDYIKGLIYKAKKEKAEFNFAVAAANRIPFKDKSFDKVVSMGIFHYFPSYAYAKEAVEEMKRVCCAKGKILIFDIPDISKKDAALKAKGETGKELLRHLFYEKDFFQTKTIDQNINHYLNSPFRFNALYEIS